MIKKYINADDIKIDSRVVNGIKEFCEREKLNPNDLFLFYDESGVIMGFSADESKYILLHDDHWIPSSTC